MKPSDRIRELQDELFTQYGYPARHFMAIEKYLDEEYNKKCRCDKDKSMRENGFDPAFPCQIHLTNPNQ
jgi:hypothetical protein